MGYVEAFIADIFEEQNRNKWSINKKFKVLPPPKEKDREIDCGELYLQFKFVPEGGTVDEAPGPINEKLFTERMKEDEL